MWGADSAGINIFAKNDFFQYAPSSRLFLVKEKRYALRVKSIISQSESRIMQLSLFVKIVLPAGRKTPYSVRNRGFPLKALYILKRVRPAIEHQNQTVTGSKVRVPRKIMPGF